MLHMPVNINGRQKPAILGLKSDQKCFCLDFLEFDSINHRPKEGAYSTSYADYLIPIYLNMNPSFWTKHWSWVSNSSNLLNCIHVQDKYGPPMVLVELRGMEERVISGVWKCDQIYLYGHRDYIELNVSDCFRWHFVDLERSGLL